VSDPGQARQKVAIVVQRYGEEVTGGAERAARAIAEHLRRIADITVLTTCALDFTTWRNHYPSGRDRLNGVDILRFPVAQARDWRRAAALTNRLLHRPHNLADEEQWIREQGPDAPKLLQFLKAEAHQFDQFIFITYVYATTYFGLPMVADRALLVPTAHDEPYLTLEAFERTFRQPQLLIHLTEPERDLVRRSIKGALPPQLVIGLGLDAPPPEPDGAARFRRKYGIDGPFMLYAGRVTESKGIPELLTYFGRFRRQSDRPLQLVLLGQVHMPLEPREDVHALGFVAEADKFDAMQAASLLVMPSAYESLSIVCLEAWHMSTPVLVNGASAVLKHQCRQSNGGLYYESYDEFSRALTRLLGDQSLRAALGAAGRRFVADRYHWPTVLARYAGVLDWLRTTTPT
jgi:glycosyltransferase involved in cell wall biosynthesis